MASALERHSASRLASCPVCNKSTHVVLIHAHVERCLEQKRHMTCARPRARGRAKTMELRDE
ncbi:hypothetical protein BE221DRAFT_108196 [Ostreococcus tauri]|uniref:UBZ4-type domain-containing protein n=1 Tax=Ostreococcus tauri TaxID=70448 RepID=A0A1Y5IMD9_OSTTA|nr:hypothetical protein BE221DRAFT_108196 [Ostreococcus tauri]